MSDRILAPAALVFTTAAAMSAAAISLLLATPVEQSAGMGGGEVLPFLREVFTLIATSFWALIQYL